MRNREQRLRALSAKLDAFLAKTKEMEMQYAEELEAVHPVHLKSAENLIHYLAVRTFDIDAMEEELMQLGFPALSAAEGHVMKGIYNLKRLINSLLNEKDTLPTNGILTIEKGNKLLNKNTTLLFGHKSLNRFTRIMVTLPNTAAEDLGFIRKLLANGMNCARINCAHDTPEDWLKMIDNLKIASKRQRKKCKIAMDLSGPKLRTGPMVEGPKVIHITPERDDLGRVVNPSKIWIAAPDIPPPILSDYQVHIPVDPKLFSKIKKGDTLRFTDARDKKCKIIVKGKDGKARVGYCSDSAYLETGTEIFLHKDKSKENQKPFRVGELLPKEQFIVLHSEDRLRLHKESIPGESTVHDENGKLIKLAHVSCTLPQVFEDAKKGEPIYFDDGKIEGIIEKVTAEDIVVKITHAKDKGSKLKADKGINLPKSDLKISGLTNKDREDIKFIAKHADAVNFSFVNSKEDILDLYNELDKLDSKIGVILKIETEKGFSNLPSILLTAMRSFPIGVMTARGDLAIETGWKNFASIQQEIMRICAAAHIPNIWATQVLENLAKKGTPSRAEITDAALAQQAECVMLNKGYYIQRAVKMLDKILRRMERFQRKNQRRLPRLENADKLQISHEVYDV
ncbi:pyruvate kinase [Maribacter sp. HTCC2170]|uniref:pyruvate kinase n=1 Tax=Maribacter sp. (strain HTCC2170 / KCCM 42371) TaxID=313603 RepID=UPI00006B483C|nr:pyruvate kinase [Maribacter sp. HTCC2170]EAR02007.1 pyruvate kinase [Maribacter sp. HTCC2170]